MEEQEPTERARYEIDFEGRFLPWPRNTITTEEICSLAGLPPGTQIIEIEADNTQRVLAPGEVEELKPGQGFAKKHKFGRG